ncbi:asparaginase [Bacillus massiliigorillae]|uniref:asparaginase n=1 Tax=Bacillus massiliigorillae TaxID=1243664 RepID=UPI0003A4077A|nr:asparaginase [Bacillus massiliigorillae]
MKKNILVIHTGGTISMFEDQATGAVKPSEQNPMTMASTQLQEDACLIIEEPFNLPSPHITPNEMLRIKNIIEEKIEQTQIDGVVITHGTDTLEETAYFLDLLLNITIPVVLTGAMRSSNEIGFDGLHNFISSIRVACTDEAANKGVLVVLNDEIHTAQNVTKTHTSNVSTFQSPQFGPIGIVTKQGVIFHHQPIATKKFNVTSITKNVPLLKAHAGMDSLLLQALSQLNIDGLVIEALGQGNLPPSTLAGIKALIEQNIPIVIVSRCFNGITQDVYGYEGGGKHLKELGIVFSNGLNGQKARLKLLAALEEGRKKEEMNTLFHA